MNWLVRLLFRFCCLLLHSVKAIYSDASTVPFRTLRTLRTPFLLESHIGPVPALEKLGTIQPR